jgi:hypothetical protein
VTTAVISGNVTDAKGAPLPGTTVIAIHVPSGTKYGAVTNASGRYTMPAVRVGGPFKVTASFVGYTPQEKGNIGTSLGTASNVDFMLSDSSTETGEVVISANRNDIFSADRTGAATTVTKDAIQALPTIGSRSIDDFTKYNPQGNGRSFGGQDSRLNNFTIDGSAFNNAFGLGSATQAGGRTGTTAISLDAIEELQVNVAPFDVRQSGFVGAGVNAITRSGTNQFSASVYNTFRKTDPADGTDQKYIGTTARGLPISISKFDEDIKGFRLGGPIIKDKLFFFVNGEFLDRISPATGFVATGSTNTGTATRVLASDLDALSKFMQTTYGYTTGPYEKFDSPTNSDKFLGRLDYNINDNNKLTVRYTTHKSQSYSNISNSNSAGNGNRTGSSTAMAFQNSGYYIKDNTDSIVSELNTTIGNRFANNLIIGYDKQNEDRAYTTDLFPTVDILSGGTTYTSVGFDPFTPSNKLNYGTFHVTDNFTIFKNNHLFTLGANFEKYKSNNLFFPASNGVWVFNSLADFYKSAGGDASVTVAKFEYRYSALPGGAEPLQVLKANKFDLYAQDEFQVSKKLKVTYGIRGGMINFGTTAIENPAVTAMSFKASDGSAYKINTGTLPKSRILWEPRLGFNFDVMGDKKTQLRGGTGIFTGRPPYVWLSNQLGNNGVLTGLIQVTSTKLYPFVKDPSIYKPANPTLPATYEINAADPDYAFPQTWKSNIAIDQKLPLGLVASGELLYNKFINAVSYINANLEPSTTKFTGPDTRPRFPGSGLTGTTQANALRVNDNITGAFVMKNVQDGDNYTATLKLEKPWTKGFYGMVAYTKSRSRDVMNAGSTASGTYSGIRSVNGNNNLPLTLGDYNIPQRVVGALSYKVDYPGRTKPLSTQISLGYVGGIGASAYSYTISGDMNGDGVSGNDLLFVPTKAADLTFVNTTITNTVNGVSTPVTYTPADQAAAFDAFIDQDPYLKTRRGQYAERNGAYLPWLNQFDVSLVQEVHFNVAKQRNTIQFRVDIQNVANLLNSDWGVGQFVNNTSPLAFQSVNAAGVPSYRLNTQTVTNTDGTRTTSLLKNTFQYSNSIGSVWQAQFGIRYIFN